MQDSSELVKGARSGGKDVSFLLPDQSRRSDNPSQDFGRAKETSYSINEVSDDVVAAFSSERNTSIIMTPLSSRRRYAGKRSARGSVDIRKAHQGEKLLRPKRMKTPKTRINLDKDVVAAERSRNKSRWRRSNRKEYSIKAQLMITFGTLNAVAVILLTIAWILIGHIAGKRFIIIAQKSFDELQKQTQGTASRYLAEDLALKLIPEDLISIVYEAANDRLIGYPWNDLPGENDDMLVPFRNMMQALNGTGNSNNTENKYRNGYPIRGEPASLDWQILPNVNEENYLEHVGSKTRWDWYNRNIDPKGISTSTASYYMQGMCNSVDGSQNTSGSTFFEGCTDDHNNIETGGVIAPSSTNSKIHRKVSDLTPLFKSLYEFHTEIRTIGLFFVNQGSGSTFQFPHYQLDSNIFYDSEVGCDWLLTTPHPLKPSRNIIENNNSEALKNIQNRSICHPKNERVTSRTFNPLERKWCYDQALHPNQIRVFGPYLDAFHNNLKVITVGKAIYDKETSELIACIAVDYVSEAINEMLIGSRLTDDAPVSVVRYDEKGTAVASSEWNTNIELNKFLSIDQISKAGVSQKAYQEIRSIVNYNDYRKENGANKWNATEVREKYEKYAYLDIDYITTGYPIPVPPDKYDTNYVPEFIALISVNRTALIDAVNLRSFVDDIRYKTIGIPIVLNSLLIILLQGIIFFVSYYLTSPLKYMNQVTNSIFDKHFNREGDVKRQNLNAKQAIANFVHASSKFLHISSHFHSASSSFMNDNSKSNTNLDDIGNIDKGGELPSEEANSTSRITTEVYKPWRFAPKTEINEVLKEFETMLSRFSSASYAKSVNINLREIRNEFSMSNEFEELFLSRYEKGFLYLFHKDGVPSENGNDENKKLISSLRRFHGGKNVISGKHLDKKDSEGGGMKKVKTIQENNIDITNENYNKKKGVARKRAHFSLIFAWIMVLTIIPFIVGTLIVSVVLSKKFGLTFDSALTSMTNELVTVKENALGVYTEHRSRLLSSIIEKPVRDLHVLTRYAGWLLLNGTSIKKSFQPEILSIMEGCRKYADIEQCPLREELMKNCDCLWNDPRGNCFHAEDTTTLSDSRYKQIPFFVAQSQDTWKNGDRNTTSYPRIADSPNSTEWYPNVTSLPGYNVESFPFGYRTTYDRIGLLSANPIYVPLYNQNNNQNSRYHLATYIGLEKDGSLIGYEGCSDISEHNIMIKNNHSLFPQNICPDGKYGYDPRCREWYQRGKAQYETNNTHQLHITPPYGYSSDPSRGTEFGQSATSPLIDTIANEYIGQTLVDFKFPSLIDVLNVKTALYRGVGFPILITQSSLRDASDTIVGPDFDLNNPIPITKVVYANDPSCLNEINHTDDNQKNIAKEIVDSNCDKKSFEKIVESMKQGGNGNGTFSVTLKDEKRQEYFMAYHPVKIKGFRSTNYADFSRGAIPSEYAFFSVALAETREYVSSVTAEVGDKFIRQIRMPCIIAIISLVIFASFCYILTSYYVAKSIFTPMVYLLHLIQKINGLDTFDNVQSIDQDKHVFSVEIVNVAKAMESLYHVVDSANTAFFEGDLEKVYTMLIDVLSMYRVLQNKKGVSIACNNLGITMLTMYRTMQQAQEDIYCGFDKQQIILKGIGYFHEAIKLGEKAYDDFYEAQGWSPICLEFMQHLSNRYFNRAMFLLTTKNDHGNPVEIEELGCKDLEIARDMDMEIVEYGNQAGWGVRTLDKLFEVTLTRSRGHLALLEMGYPDEWEIEEMHRNAFKRVETESKKEKKNSDKILSLFTTVTAIGRLQQIETEIIKYRMIKGDIDTAAKIAIRMLINDEFTFADSHLKAVEVLIKYLDSKACEENVGKDKPSENFCEKELLKYQKRLLRFAEGSGDGDIMSIFSSKESKRGDVTMEHF